MSSRIYVPNCCYAPKGKYLQGEGLLKIRTLDGKVSITHEGILEIKEAIENPDKRTEHFPPINIINIHSMENSVIQQGSPGGVQNVTFNEGDLGQIRKIVDKLETRLESIIMPADSLNELRQEIETLKVQLASPKPNRLFLMNH